VVSGAVHSDPTQDDVLMLLQGVVVFESAGVDLLVDYHSRSVVVYGL